MLSSDLQVSTLDAISSLSLFLPPIYDMLFHVVDVVFSVLQSYNYYFKYPNLIAKSSTVLTTQFKLH